MTENGVTSKKKEKKKEDLYTESEEIRLVN